MRVCIRILHFHTFGWYWFFLSFVFIVKRLTCSIFQKVTPALNKTPVLWGHRCSCSDTWQICFVHDLYKSITWKNEGCSWMGNKKNWSSCILHDLQVVGGGRGGYSKGLRVKTNIHAWSFYAFAEDLVVFEVFTTESCEEMERQTGIERVRIGRAAREGEKVTEVWSPWVETVPAWAYREQMTVALVSFAELTVLLPYITPPIVLFQLFGEKS